MGQIFRFFRDRIAPANAERATLWAHIFQARRGIAACTIRMDKRTLVLVGQYYNPTPEQRAELLANTTRKLANRVAA